MFSISFTSTWSQVFEFITSKYVYILDVDVGYYANERALGMVRLRKVGTYCLSAAALVMSNTSNILEMSASRITSSDRGILSPLLVVFARNHCRIRCRFDIFDQKTCCFNNTREG